MVNNQPPQPPETIHDSTDEAIQHIENSDLEALAKYLSTLQRDYEIGRRSPDESDRFIQIENVTEKSVDIAYLVDFAVYYGRVWQREHGD